MPMLTARKKLLFPAVLIVLGLFALACLPGNTGREDFEIDHGGGTYLPLEGGFAAVSPSGISAWSMKGGLLFGEELPLMHELCAPFGAGAAVVSSQQVRLYSPGEPPKVIEGGAEILALDAWGDYLAVSREDSLYGSAVTFYKGADALFTRYLASGECTQILLTDSAACLLLPEEIQILTSPEDAVKIPLSAKRIYPAYGGICAETEGSLRFYSLSGEERGVYQGAFAQVCSFGDTLCALVPQGAAVIGPTGAAEHIFNELRPIGFGMGDTPAVIMGETTFIFDEKMEFLYSIENKYIPLNVITNKEGAVLLWQRSAHIHRK